MSLLIKALDKAEKAQEEQSNAIKTNRRRATNIVSGNGFEQETTLDLQLEGKPEHNLTQEFYAAQYSDGANERAATVFEAKQPPVTGVSPLRWAALFGLLALLTIAVYFYNQLTQLEAPPVVASPPSTDLPAPTTSATPTPVATIAQTEIVAQALPAPTVTPVEAKTEVAQTAEVHRENQNEVTAAMAQPTQDALVNNSKPRSSGLLATNEEKIVPYSALSFDAPIASKSVSIHISKAKPAPTVNPSLMSAYEAYLAGHDAEAQALYKQVLQVDMRNVDALLGLGAIAERQGRLLDATDWYHKVLAIEPRNSIALAAIYSSQLQADAGGLTPLKNLLAKEPDNANLHTELGNWYAEQNQWAEAQHAYFEAYRLNPSAEHAFNLAVGLDQLGKPTLALPYYLEALAKHQQLPNHTLDEAGLQQRIQAIQSQK